MGGGAGGMVHHGMPLPGSHAGCRVLPALHAGCRVLPALSESSSIRSQIGQQDRQRHPPPHTKEAYWKQSSPRLQAAGDEDDPAAACCPPLPEGNSGREGRAAGVPVHPHIVPDLALLVAQSPSNQQACHRPCLGREPRRYLDDDDDMPHALPSSLSHPPLSHARESQSCNILPWMELSYPLLGGRE